MIQGKVSPLLRIGAPITLIFALVFLFVPSAFASTKSATASSGLIGPKQFYLALGDSLAFGFQPNLDNNHGYADDFFNNDLRSRGVQHYANMGCSGETTSTMINGLCIGAALRKFPYVGSQLLAAVTFLRLHPGQVSPVTLDIGANDIDTDTNPSTCVINPKVNSDVATMDANLTQIILPQLVAAMTVNGHITGDLLIMNYYDPLQNRCPNTVSATQQFNQHLAADAKGFGTMVDVFDAFGGATVPNPNICTFTWMCSNFPFLLAIHATTKGYQVIANTFEQTAGY